MLPGAAASPITIQRVTAAGIEVAILQIGLPLNVRPIAMLAPAGSTGVLIVTCRLLWINARPMSVPSRRTVTTAV